MELIVGNYYRITRKDNGWWWMVKLVNYEKKKPLAHVYYANSDAVNENYTIGNTLYFSRNEHNVCAWTPLTSEEIMLLLLEN